MKKIILPLVMLTLAAAPAAAQIVRSTTFTKQETPKVVVAENPIHDYDLLGFYYTLEKFSPKYEGNDDPDPVNTNGFQFKYLHGFSVSKSLPMFVEFGADIHYGTGKEDTSNDYVKNKYQVFDLAVPVNFAYRFQIADFFAIKPFIGLNFKINLLGRSRTELTDDFMNDYEEVYGHEYDGERNSEWIDLFSSDDMGGSDYTWNRFQLGWHLGVDFEFNKFFIGLNYGTDFIPAWKYKKNKVNSQTFNIGLGFVF